MMNDQTRELFEKYKDEVLTFERYYKFSFMYTNEKIWVSAGGDSNGIYRAELLPHMTLDKLVGECGDEFLVIQEATK